MRRILDGLYRASGIAGAGFVLAILLVVVGQVACNIVDTLAEWLTGRAIGLLIPSYATFAGYFLAVGSFLALGYAFARGAHIRVTLVIMRMPDGLRRPVEIIAAAIAFGLATYATWYMIELTRQSWRFGDVSSGLVPVKLWIPQTGMATGLAILTVATLDRLVLALAGRLPREEDAEGILSEDPNAEGT